MARLWSKALLSNSCVSRERLRLCIERNFVSRRKHNVPSHKTIIVLHLAGQYPMAGVIWQALQYVAGFRQLGHDVYYVEDSGAPPYDPRVKSIAIDPAYNVACLQHAFACFGLADRWVYWDMPHDTYYGISKTRLRELYERADLVINLCGATP